MVLPAPSIGVRSVVIDGSMVLYDPVGGQVHLLSAVARVVWEACVGRVHPNEVCSGLAEGTGTGIDEVTDGVVAFLDDMEERQLLGRTEANADGDLESGSADRDEAEEVDGARFASGPFAVLDDRVVVRGENRAVLTAVEDLFGPMAVVAGGEQAAGPTAGRVREFAVVAGPKNHLHLTGPDTDAVFDDVGALLEDLPTALNTIAASASTCLALHSGAVVAPSGAVVLLPAVSGSGKTTLTAALVQAGFGYLSDEAVGVRAGSLAPLRYQKPLVLDATSRDALGLSLSSSDNVPVDEIRDGAAKVGEVGPVTHVVLPTYQPGASPALTDLSSVEAFVAVAEHALNLRLVGQVGLDTLAELAERVPCHRLVHGGIAEAVPVVEALIGSH